MSVENYPYESRALHTCKLGETIILKGTRYEVLKSNTYEVTLKGTDGVVTVPSYTLGRLTTAADAQPGEVVQVGTTRYIVTPQAGRETTPRIQVTIGGHPRYLDRTQVCIISAAPADPAPTPAGIPLGTYTPPAPVTRTLVEDLKAGTYSPQHTYEHGGDKNIHIYTRASGKQLAVEYTRHQSWDVITPERYTRTVPSAPAEPKSITTDQFVTDGKHLYLTDPEEPTEGWLVLPTGIDPGSLDALPAGCVPCRITLAKTEAL